ncbi:hypothetical protein SKAU_G00344000 [Synaphobranchus kaupii]|uniref:Uncharacterized protein n=1 Tax=Synaphobranchus kaupii TaxID=118154 RepID=A0A9Q1IHA8_SYNKA|nr:hypothetical protein SKAU_G00344000 [Synaphobranchus kaupii]
MKPAAVVCVLLITLQLKQTGSAMNSSLDGESGELCTTLEKLVQVKDKAMTREMKVLLEALFEAFSQCITDLTKAPTSTTASPTPTPTPPEETPLTTATDVDMAKTATSTTAATSTLPPSDKHLAKTPTSPTVTSTPAAAGSKFPPPDAKRRKQDLQRLPESVSTPESASPNDSRGKEEVQGSPKSDKKFLWIILGILGALMLATILVLKSKVLICTRIHTYADVADYMEEKMYRKNDDIVLLGVTPGTEGEDDCYFSPKGSPGYEEISPRSTY